MPGDEIEVPKELREFMLEGAEETFLGQKNGAQKQYRYGNLHIREYNEKFLVHTDRIDPRKDPIGHLVHDAPEILIGLACAIFGGSEITKKFLKKKSKKTIFVSSLFTSIISGYMGYTATKKIRNSLE
ncbi:MAG TPA: hypothetical protein QF518_07635 [Nitrosopumilus sp.]|jgi:hypothetical protein|nr:hypothetical protein [Nitrosopumilus sp.]HJM26223.1 hypothetical protein [Nitrosopumilus sp.]HJO32472.1 hypothetical protein [Nitrosopumilus sp.]|tara:strand:- start:10161 stop:10544 length:384 start_codon:yes stop_codon:yes gene_type:complete